MIPARLWEAQEKAKVVAADEKPASRMAAVVIVAVRLFCVALAVFGTSRLLYSHLLGTRVNKR